MSDYSSVSADLGPIADKTRSISKELFDFAVANGNDIWHMWGYDPDAGNTEHHSGLALDLMVHNSKDGQNVRDYIWANRARLGLKHVIWEQHITSTVVQPGVVRLMEDRGDPTANHMDHVHALFFAGDYVAPGAPSSPDPSTPVHLSDPLKVDGQLGPKTIARWQEIMGTPVDGVIDTNRPSVLVTTVQRRLKASVDWRLVVDGYGIAQDNHAYKTVGALQRYLGSPVDCVWSLPVSQGVMALQRRLNEGRF